jgi:hypothetical protein
MDSIARTRPTKTLLSLFSIGKLLGHDRKVALADSLVEGQLLSDRLFHIAPECRLVPPDNRYGSEDTVLVVMEHFHVRKRFAVVFHAAEILVDPYNDISFRGTRGELAEAIESVEKRLATGNHGVDEQPLS